MNGINLETYTNDINWRVRYAAAVAMGESHDKKWLTSLEEMFVNESKLPLYTQPPVHFPGKPEDATRLSEHIGPITVVFDQYYDEETKEAWRCRGRVKQAILYAVYEIGHVHDEFLDKIHNCLEEIKDDYCVVAAAARALGRIGNDKSLRCLENALSIDEWCTVTEAKKAKQSLHIYTQG